MIVQLRFATCKRTLRFRRVPRLVLLITNY